VLCRIEQSHDSPLCCTARSRDSLLCSIVQSADSGIAQSRNTYICNMKPDPVPDPDFERLKPRTMVFDPVLNPEPELDPDAVLEPVPDSVLDLVPDAVPDPMRGWATRSNDGRTHDSYIHCGSMRAYTVPGQWITLLLNCPPFMFPKR
jgi:hypothetical protein